ncbi:hypothetical protein [Endozoicomonas sp. Mp262]|uniref:hypothetical protein n=1 Tax=Endozoicomonas sp. Mp262 TaxID=2919499 RepID=UPI0021D880C4
MFAVREQKMVWSANMLKPQDLLVTLKVLRYEKSIQDQGVIAKDMLGKAWVHPKDDIEKISLYDREKDEIIVSDEIDDFDQADLAVIDEFLSQNENEQVTWTYRKLASQLFMSLSEANQSAKRAIAAGLLISKGRRGVRVNRRALVNFIQHGVGISFFTERGQIVRGIPTAYAAPVFNQVFASSSDYPPVWPCARGTMKGVAISPLFKSVSKAVMIDSWLYQQLALVDIYRIGSAREKEEALPFLNELKGE